MPPTSAIEFFERIYDKNIYLANDSNAGLLQETQFNNTGFDNLGYEDSNLYDADPLYQSINNPNQKQIFEDLYQRLSDQKEEAKVKDNVKDEGSQNISRNLLLKSFGDEVLI